MNMKIRKLKFAWKYKRFLWKYRGLLRRRKQIAGIAGVAAAGAAIGAGVYAKRNWG